MNRVLGGVFTGSVVYLLLFFYCSWLANETVSQYPFLGLLIPLFAAAVAIGVGAGVYSFLSEEKRG